MLKYYSASTIYSKLITPNLISIILWELCSFNREKEKKILVTVIDLTDMHYIFQSLFVFLLTGKLS